MTASPTPPRRAAAAAGKAPGIAPGTAGQGVVSGALRLHLGARVLLRGCSEPSGFPKHLPIVSWVPPRCGASSGDGL